MTHFPLLNVRQDNKGSFIDWLKELGLNELISRYPLSKLIEWGWLVPINPIEFNGGCLNEGEYFFFHWQAYALVDVLQRASMDTYPILNTPNIEQDIGRIASCKIKPTDVLQESQSWGRFAKPMIWLSHYRVFRESLPYETNRDQIKELLQNGAKQLADNLGIDADILEKAIKEQLLEGLAGNWVWANEHYCEWTLRAWPNLQKDICLAMEWLFCLNGKPLTDYFEKWHFENREVWPPLHKVLPYEDYEDKLYFLKIFPKYKRFYDGIFPADETLKDLVNDLQKSNSSFNSLLNAFRQFHENLLPKPKEKGGIDFRVLRPLDYYSLLAIRAEVCLRYALGDAFLLANEKIDSLKKYIEEWACRRRISDKVIQEFKSYTKGVNDITRLNRTPDDPIGVIMAIRCSHLNDEENYLLQAFLCCNLARNYFAHHTYLDKEFLATKDGREKSGFMLAGISVTVLILLKIE